MECAGKASLEVHRAVPDMRPASRLAGAALKGLLLSAQSATAQPPQTHTSLAAVIQVDSNSPVGPVEGLEAASAVSNQPATFPQPAAKPSGRLAGNALKALGPSANTARRPRSAASASGAAQLSAFHSAAQHSPEAGGMSGASQLEAGELTAADVPSPTPSAGVLMPSGKLASSALKALGTAAPR